jgi:hypothetical protein
LVPGASGQKNERAQPLETKNVIKRFGGPAAAAARSPRIEEITGSIAADAPSVLRNCRRLIAIARISPP